MKNFKDAVKIMRCGAQEGIPSLATRCLPGHTMEIFRLCENQTAGYPYVSIIWGWPIQSG